MNLLFIHGMGRSSLSAWPLLRMLKIAGIITYTFNYSTMFEDFKSIEKRLIKKLSNLNDYVVVGHSLGGVLIRSALNNLPKNACLPKHVFLLGSPQKESLLAVKFSSNLLFKLLTTDCGKLLSSSERMSSIKSIAIPTTVIIGTKNIPFLSLLFSGETNDGIVSESEVKANWAINEIYVPVIHSLLPSSKYVSKIILNWLSSIQM
jgi:hypothetical protein